jgi:hypothetical protein
MTISTTITSTQGSIKSINKIKSIISSTISTSLLTKSFLTVKLTNTSKQLLNEKNLVTAKIITTKLHEKIFDNSSNILIESKDNSGVNESLIETTKTLFAKSSIPMQRTSSIVPMQKQIPQGYPAVVQTSSSSKQNSKHELKNLFKKNLN